MQSRKQRLGARTSLPLLLFIVLLIIVQNRLMDINWGIMLAIFCLVGVLCLIYIYEGGPKISEKLGIG